MQSGIMNSGKSRRRWVLLLVLLTAVLSFSGMKFIGLNPLELLAQQADSPKPKTQEPSAQPDILAQLRQIPTATLADAIDELVTSRGFMSHDMRPVNLQGRIAGRARTVLYGPVSERGPEKNLGPRYEVQLIDKSGPGDILVVAMGDLNITGLGGLMATTAKVRGMEGVVVDGAVRDVEQIQGVGLSVFSRSISPASLLGRATSLAHSVPVVCGGVTVSPGDYIVGDRDGVVCIPQSKIEAVLRRSREMEESEAKMMPKIYEIKSLEKVIEMFKRI